MLSKKDLLMNPKHIKLQDYIAFYGAKSAGEKIDDSCLSNHFVSSFKKNMRMYNCVEQYMMAMKAQLFHDRMIFDKIMEQTNPSAMKNLGRLVRNFDAYTWDRKKIEIVREGIRCKFSQNENLKVYLLSTGNAILIEAAPRDKIWGVGMGKTNSDIQFPKLWRGENLLGFILMDVREELKGICL